MAALGAHAVRAAAEHAQRQETQAVLAHELRNPLTPIRTVAARGGPVVHGDAHRLAQVFSNLLENAPRYTRVGGEIG